MDSYNSADSFDDHQRALWLAKRFRMKLKTEETWLSEMPVIPLARGTKIAGGLVVMVSAIPGYVWVTPDDDPACTPVEILDSDLYVDLEHEDGFGYALRFGCLTNIIAFKVALASVLNILSEGVLDEWMRTRALLGAHFDTDRLAVAKALAEIVRA